MKSTLEKTNKSTQDQIAHIMLLFGTPAQQEEALRYCGYKVYEESLSNTDVNNFLSD